MNKKWIISFVFLVILATLLGFIYSAKANDKPTIDIVLKNSDSQYWKYMKAGMVKAAANMGMNENIYLPEKNDEDQLKILQRVLKNKPNALIVSLSNPTMAKPILEEYKKKHIPVLLVDTEADWPGQTCFIGTDNSTLGQKAGELLSSMLQPGDKVALIGLLANNSTSTDRTEGAKETLTAAGINVITDKRISVKNNNINTVMNNILQKNPDLQGVYAVNDEIAIDVLKFLQEKGIKIPVIGSDGSIEIISHIENGTIEGTIAQNPYDIGYLSIDNARIAMKGENVEKVINTGVDIITKDNAKSKKDFLEQILKE